MVWAVVMYLLTLISALSFTLINVKEQRGISNSDNTTNVEAEAGCEDDVYKDCARRAETGACTGEAGSEDPHQEARLALAECRQSCQALINKNFPQSELPGIVQLYGGVQVTRQQISNTAQYWSHFK